MSAIQDKVQSIISFFQSLLPGDENYLEDDIDSANSYEVAKDNGWKVVLPTANQLFVDIDNDFSFALFEKNIAVLWQWYEPSKTGAQVEIHPSKGGGEGWHITVNLAEPITNEERIILQTFLGSDLRREFLSLQRIRNMDPRPTLFFEVDENKKEAEIDIPF